MNERLPKFKGQKLLAEIEKSTSGLVYISETDAPIEPFFGGTSERINVNQIVQHVSDSRDHETVNAEQFFARLTTEKDWSKIELLKESLVKDGMPLWRVDVEIRFADAGGSALMDQVRAVLRDGER